ncbi:MAG: TonB-dependent receptor [Bacteroidaceae bacterium]|nr:TonB-dependent receptor [Bacteroidaceae bacterium]
MNHYRHFLSSTKAALLLALLFGCLPLRAQIRGFVQNVEGDAIAGANIVWAGTSKGTVSNEKGGFFLEPITGKTEIVTSFIGYANDTLRWRGESSIIIVLREGIVMNDVEIASQRTGMKLNLATSNTELIETADLLRFACCNLGESFSANPSVDVSYSDAATGAKQIKLLGLSGRYVQMLTENIPNFRGAATPFALSYVPGPWMQSIQVSKGAATVKNGYESITGQINIEFLKPQSEEALDLNVYGDSKGKAETNMSVNYHLSDKLSTGLLVHMENNFLEHDMNHDNFVDMPRVKQYNIQNRWMYHTDLYALQASVKGMSERRHGGNMQTFVLVHPETNPYSIDISTRRWESFVKNAYFVNPDKGSNIALILSGSRHVQDAVYGKKFYGIDELNGYASLMYETDIDDIHSLSTGASLNFDDFRQDYSLVADGVRNHDDEKECVPGAYVQYTFNLHDKLVMMGGIRADYSNLYGAFVTPRAHIKWAPNDIFSLRASGGKGYRTPHVLAESHNMLASSRQIVIDKHLKQEEAWNSGISASLHFPLFDTPLTLSLEYYYTHIINQLVADMDTDPHAVHFHNLQGTAFSHTTQANATYDISDAISVSAAFRFMDARTTYNGILRELPLTSHYKSLFSGTWKSPLELWQVDVTLQMNGGGRLPNPYTLPDGNLSWDATYEPYQILNAQVTRLFRWGSIYAGGENLTGTCQEYAIIDASNPWGGNFDSTMIWGPLEKAMFYAGIRFKFKNKQKN